MRKNIQFLIFLLIPVYLSAQTGSIYNITAAQRTDGFMIVDIYYDLNGDVLPYRILVETSFNGGADFTTLVQVSGDVGENIFPGTAKLILWDFGEEFPGSFSNSTQIRLTAIPTCGILTDIRDGQHYSTLKTNTQCWMAENLNIGNMIPDDVVMSDDGILEKYCYENNPINCDTYGGLYRWHEAMQYSVTPGTQGICPTGWHLPTNDDWCLLAQWIDASVDCYSWAWSGLDVGTKMKSTSGWTSGNGTNASGFNALPAGGSHFDGGYFDLGNLASYWTSEDFYIYGAWCRQLKFDKTEIARWAYHRGYGMNVRCVKD